MTLFAAVCFDERKGKLVALQWDLSRRALIAAAYSGHAPGIVAIWRHCDRVVVWTRNEAEYARLKRRSDML